MNASSPTSPQLIASPQPAAAGEAPPRFPYSLLFVVWLAVALVATLVTLVLPESFTSTARIKLERDHADIRGISDQAPAWNPYDPYFIQTEFETIQSEIVLSRVIDGLNLNELWGKKYYDGLKLKTSESLALLRRALDVRPVRNTTLMDIRVYSDNPKEAADIANRIAETYKQWRAETYYEMVRGSLKSLEDRAKEMDAKIAYTKKELASLAGPVDNGQLPDLKTLNYLEKKQALEEMYDLRRMLTRRINVEDIDLRLPRSAQVTIIEHAVAQPKPVRPNVPLNLWLGILVGGLLGTLLATLVYLLQRRAFRRKSGAAIPKNLRGFRTFLRVTIGLVVGVIVGYNCAMPWDAASLLITQVCVFLAGLAFAFIELAKPSSAAIPATSQPERPPPAA